MGDRMEFSYKLSEADYLLASGTAAKRPGRPWARLLAYGNLTLVFLIIWGALLAGMFLEQSDLAGLNPSEIQTVPLVRQVVPASIVPALCLFCLVFLLLRMRILRWLDRQSRREHFRADPGCQAETTVTLTPQSIAFRSVAGSSESVWDGYATWAERNGILVLVTRAGVRKIMKIASLSESEKVELRGILSAALPKE
jgi:hypothetical protein